MTITETFVFGLLLLAAFLTGDFVFLTTGNSTNKNTIYHIKLNKK